MRAVFGRIEHEHTDPVTSLKAVTGDLGECRSKTDLRWQSISGQFASGIPAAFFRTGRADGHECNHPCHPQDSRIVMSTGLFHLNVTKKQ